MLLLRQPDFLLTTWLFVGKMSTAVQQFQPEDEHELCVFHARSGPGSLSRLRRGGGDVGLCVVGDFEVKGDRLEPVPFCLQF